MMTRCDLCKNEAPTYWRRTYRVCEHCAALNPGLGRVRDEDHVNFLDPINQPNALNNRPYPRAQPCVWCGVAARSAFRWYTGEITACGWGHAGFWMDKQMGLENLAEGEKYVRESLGVQP